MEKKSPEVALEAASGGETIDFLNDLKPLETSSKIGEAILLAGELMAGKEGRVIVLSDFINTEGTPPEIAADILRTKNIVVDLINVASGKSLSNVGIVDLDVDEDTTTLYIKNYNDKTETVTVRIANFEKTLTLQPKSIETFAITTPEKVTKVELNVDDDFAVDNFAFISAPSKDKIKINLVSNRNPLFLKAALESGEQTEVTISEPPIISKDPFDIIVLDTITPGKILPGTFEDLKEKIQKDGTSLVIHAHNDLQGIDYKDLLPVNIEGVESGAPMVIEQVNRFTKNIDFGSVQKYFVAANKDNAITIVSGKNSSIIALTRLGRGKIAYYGIMEDASEFKFSPGYPIFWNNLIEFLIDKKSVKNLNAKTGDTLILEGTEKITLPSGKKISQGTLIYEQQGVYTVGDREIAVNLLNERESDIIPKQIVGQSSAKIELKPINEERTLDWEIPLLIAAAVMMLLELLYIKFRGDV